MGPPGRRGMPGPRRDWPGRPVPDGGPRRPPGDMWDRLPEEKRHELSEFMEKHFPRLREELEDLKESAPERFQRRMRRIAPQMWDLMEINKTDAERGALMIQERRLDIQVKVLIHKYRTAEDGPRRDDVRRELRSVVGEIFDCRQRRRQLELRRLEARMAEMKGRLDEMQGQRDRLVEREVDEHLNRPAKPPERREAEEQDER